MKISPARIAAFEALERIGRRREQSSAVLADLEAGLSPADGGLCHQIVLGVLRRQMMLDRQIDGLTAGRRIDDEVRTVLRIALFQLLHLDRVPAHAVVNDAVNLTMRAKKTSAKGFVNAILRKSLKSVPSPDISDEIERMAIESSHPRWLIERWERQFGKDQTARLVAANNVPSDSDFRPTLRTSEAVLRSIEKEDIPNRAEYLRELAANGKIYFQDGGSQLVAQAAKLKDGDAFLDVCASPGGKTTLVAYLAKDLNVKIVAGDVSAPRVSTLAENCRRQGADGISVVRFDAESLPFAEASFDIVLVDAPCSGTGTIRSNPEIRYNLSETDFESFAGKQLRILQSASKMVKLGGRLVYSTCSLETVENEDVCRRFLDSNPGFSVVQTGIPDRFDSSGGFSRTMPQRDGMDGFFVAAFEKL